MARPALELSGIPSFIIALPYMMSLKAGVRAKVVQTAPGFTMRNRTIRTSVTLPEGSYVEIQALAEANDVSTAWVIRQAVVQYLSSNSGQRELPLPSGRAAR